LARKRRRRRRRRRREGFVSCEDYVMFVNDDNKEMIIK
jgi:hypothetical protein